MLRTRLKIEPETGLDMYLGCNQSKGNVTLGNGHRVTTVTYDTEQFLRSCVDRYLEVAGDVKLNKVVTPELHEETKNHVSRKPAREGPSVVCNWCNNLVPTDGSATVPDQRGGTPEMAMKEPVRGHLAPHAASILMKLLYGARIARFDLLRQVNRLARNVHRWTDSDDRGLRHLMCYVHHTKHWRMVGWVGEPMDDVHLALYADADFAGCVDSLRSTSGGHLNIQGPNTRFPLSGSSERQGCVSHSTPEAEIVAADVAMRSMGMPALKLVERILKKSPNFVFYDDNKAMIGVVRSGRNPTMRHLERSHGVKGPRLMRVKPPVMTPTGSKWLRSTWFLKNGSWLKVEDRVDPGLQCVRIDGWVERAVWQFHPVPVAVPARERSPRPRPIHVGSGDVDMQSVLAAFVEELSNERIELKCVNDLALETLLRLKLLMRCLHINHEQLVPGRCFVPYRIAVKHKPQLAPGIELAMVKHDGGVLRAPVRVSLPGMRTRTVVTLYSVDLARPIVLMACSEPRNWFTALTHHDGPQVVTITLVDDLLSEYGGRIARHVLTKPSDLLFFAGPCAGGSSWARLNKTRGIDTAEKIEAKQREFWRLFERFVEFKRHAMTKRAAILFELPGSCDYWKDERLHDGLKQRYAKKPMPIKKPHGTLTLVARCLRGARETMSMDLVPVVKPKKPSCARL